MRVVAAILKLLLVLGILGFLLFGAFLIGGNFFGSNPVLTDEQTKWQGYERGVENEDSNYPIEVIEDGYKFIKAYRVPFHFARDYTYTKKGGKWVPATNFVQWGWRLTARNRSNQDLEITVKYVLLEKDGFPIISDTETKHLKAGETLTFQNTSTLPFNDAMVVRKSDYKISYVAGGR